MGVESQRHKVTRLWSNWGHLTIDRHITESFTTYQVFLYSQPREKRLPGDGHGGNRARSNDLLQWN